VSSLAIHENQRLIGTKAAQCGRPNVIGSVVDGWPREVDRRGEHLNDLARFGAPGLAYLSRREDIDRNRRLEDGSIRGSSAGDHDVVEAERSADEREVLSHCCSCRNRTYRRPGISDPFTRSLTSHYDSRSAVVTCQTVCGAH
jgi:hypothetical protein